jgi:phosphatidyl-myo-inositol alpha-mannosyltransferase
MGVAGKRPRVRRRVVLRRLAYVVGIALVAGLVVYALLNLDLHRVGHALVTANFAWIVAALALMGTSLLMRAISWHAVLRAALPGTPIRWPPVIRATMIGVMGSAVFPGRIGEPSRVIVLSRRLEGRTRHQIPIVAGTVFSQTLINLVALGILLAITFTSVPVLNGNVAGAAGALIVPFAAALLIVVGPRLVRRGCGSRHERIASASRRIEALLVLARQGLTVFARPRWGALAVFFQLLAWALQWLACYAVLLAMHLQHDGGLVAAAAILLAVNLSAVLPATPSNVGVFQAATAVVLGAYGVAAGPGVAYGIILQAVEVVTALALGVPALLGEGLTLGELRREARAGEEAGRRMEQRAERSADELGQAERSARERAQ